MGKAACAPSRAGPFGSQNQTSFLERMKMHRRNAQINGSPETQSPQLPQRATPTRRKIHSDSDREEPTGEQWSLLLGCPTGYDMYWSRAGLGDPLKPRLRWRSCTSNRSSLWGGAASPRHQPCRSCSPLSVPLSCASPARLLQGLNLPNRQLRTSFLSAAVSAPPVLTLSPAPRQSRRRA